MNRRAIIAFLLGLALSQPLPASAQGNGTVNGAGTPAVQDGGDAPDPGNATGGSDNPGQSSPPEDVGGVAGEGEIAPSEPAPLPEPAPAPEPVPATPPAVAGDAELTQSDVLAAVEDGSALPLETLLPDVRSRTGGEVIDAKLHRTQGALVYTVTVLTPAGKVTTQHYDAQSGQYVERR